MDSAMSLAEASGARRRPGSPWMPMPSSISPSGRSKIGLPAAGGGHGGGEDLAGAGGVQHAEADEAGVQRLVAGAAARDQADLALAGGVAAHHDLAVGVVAQQVRVRGRQAGQ